MVGPAQELPLREGRREAGMVVTSKISPWQQLERLTYLENISLRCKYLLALNESKPK
jgi:hypothetical protein